MEEITTVATLLRNDNYVTTLILTDVCEDFDDKSDAKEAITIKTKSRIMWLF